MSQKALTILNNLLQTRLTAPALEFWQKSQAELADGVPTSRFSTLISLASRHTKRCPLGLNNTEIAAIQALDPALKLQTWTQQELLRVALVLSRGDINEPGFAEDYEGLFVYADEGETCALYRALALLPNGERFAWRAGEGCRTNMLSVFSAIALDSPYPERYFDETAWKQLVMKSLFLELPLARVQGIDKRRSGDLTRMVLDFAEERSSAGRTISQDIWLCLEGSDPSRTQALAEQRWGEASDNERAAIVLGLARAGLLSHTEQLIADTKLGPVAERALGSARKGAFEHQQFAALTANTNEI